MLALALLLTLCGAALVTGLLIPPIIRFSDRRQLYDRIGEARKVHTRPISRLGGIAIFAGFMAGMLISLMLAPPGSPPQGLERYSREVLHLTLLMVGASFTCLVMLADDLRGLTPLQKIGAQVLAALIAIGPYLWQQQLHEATPTNQSGASGIVITAFQNPLAGGQVHLHNIWPPLAIIVTIVWVVAMMNTINLVDGLDGLAGSVTLVASLVLMVHALMAKQHTIALLPAALAGACLGFLWFNVHPARIFMGDAGAMTIGYILALSAIIGGAKFATIFLVLLVPILDVAWLILSRTLSGGRFHQAGRDHLHHRLFDLGMSQRQVMLLYCALNGLPGMLALLLPAGKIKLYILLVLGGMLLALLALLPRPGGTKSESS